MDRRGDGAHGDLLDLIAATRRLGSLGEALTEARRFLGVSAPGRSRLRWSTAPAGSTQAARRLWSMGRPVAGTLAERYLAGRGLGGLGQVTALRFHPRCYYGRDGDAGSSQVHTLPALLAKVTDVHSNLTGLQRTYLDPATAGKAPVACPRKAMGALLGHGVRIGTASDLLAAGEGLETMLSLRLAIPKLPVVAALSANHLAALILPDGARRLYIAVDRDAAGRHAAARLAARAAAAGVEAILLQPIGADLNTDLRALGRDDLRAHLRSRIAPTDVEQLTHMSTA